MQPLFLAPLSAANPIGWRRQGTLVANTSRSLLRSTMPRALDVGDRIGRPPHQPTHNDTCRKEQVAATTSRTRASAFPGQYVGVYVGMPVLSSRGCGWMTFVSGEISWLLEACRAFCVLPRPSGAWAGGRRRAPCVDC